MNVIRYITIYQGRLTFGCEKIRQGHSGPVWSRNGWRILTAQPVGRGIHEGEVSGECTARNLIVIVGGTPTADPADRVRIPDVAILEIGCVYHEASEANDMGKRINTIPFVQSQYGW